MEFLRVEDDDKEFRAHYRVPYSVFQAVLKRIRHRIERDDKEQIRSSGAPIDAETMLAVTLRWLAGGTWQEAVKGVRIRHAGP